MHIYKKKTHHQDSKRESVLQLNTSLSHFHSCFEDVLHQESHCPGASEVKRTVKACGCFDRSTNALKCAVNCESFLFLDGSDGMWTIQEIEQRAGVINGTPHRQTQAGPPLVYHELTDVQKNWDPTVLFPCAEREGKTKRDEEGGRVGSETTSSVSSGNADWRQGRKCRRCVCKLESEQSTVDRQ